MIVKALKAIPIFILVIISIRAIKFVIEKTETKLYDPKSLDHIDDANEYLKKHYDK